MDIRLAPALLTLVCMSAQAETFVVTRFDDPNSHRNYHLGFRCCKDLKGAPNSR